MRGRGRVPGPSLHPPGVCPASAPPKGARVLHGDGHPRQDAVPGAKEDSPRSRGLRRATCLLLNLCLRVAKAWTCEFKPLDPSEGASRLPGS